MNLMEIGKNSELQPTETAEQPKNSETITESLTQPSQTPEESPIKLKVERCWKNMCREYMCMMTGEWGWSINSNKLAYNNNKIVDKKQ